MDYDRWDALLHHIFKQTQGDAWFRPAEENLSSGVALRVSDDPPEYRVFPYENLSLEPFEAAVKKLNPVVAVKVRSASVHAALADVPPGAPSIYVDANTRIQILDSILHLPHADKEQCAAFIRDERVLIVWSNSLDGIIPTCQDFEDRLIKLLWRSRPTGPDSPSLMSSTPEDTASVSAHSLVSRSGMRHSASSSSRGGSNLPPPPSSYPPGASIAAAAEVERESKRREAAGLAPKTKRRWWGKKYTPDEEELTPERKVMLYAPVYNGLAAGLAVVFIGNGIKTLLREMLLDGTYIRFALCITLPFLYCVSLFFTLQILQNVTMAIGPIAHYHQNSKYYSAVPPKPLSPTHPNSVEAKLPHITIQMPVYKESLETVLAPSIASLKRAMQTYARQGGTSAIFVCDDGLRTNMSRADRDERIRYYRNEGIGWVARPREGCPAGGVARDPDDPEKQAISEKKRPKVVSYHRAGRFKKASNMNYGLALSLCMEKHLETLVDKKILGNQPARRFSIAPATPRSGSAINLVRTGQYGVQYMNKDGDDMAVGGQFAQDGTARYSSVSSPLIGAFANEVPGTPNPAADEAYKMGLEALFADEDLEEEALQLAIEEMYDESRKQGDGEGWKPWAANGKAMRVGEIVLLVDSDTVVPEDCLRDAAREMAEDENVAIIQHESDVMQVAHHYFENGIAYFTRRINRSIGMACANGEVAPFVGHNAFLRWRAIQDAAFVDPDDGKEKIWSESNVSEDFDMALRLLQRGYLIRWATYSNGGFKEGVSLTVDDELNRWQKYAYGCNELLFNPLVSWWRKGPIAKQIHRFMWSKAPIHYKISMMAYMFSYYGIAASVTIGIINYVLLGFMLPVDGFYMHSFEIWLATTVVFFGSGNVGYTLLEYRLGHKQLIWGFLENVMWIPFFFFFFGGLSIPVSQAILAHLFSYNISWSATIKEVQRSNFFKEIPKIIKRFWFSLLVSIIIIVAMIILSTNLVPYEWRVDGSSWAVIFPLAVVTACHILFPILLNPWLMVFSY